MQRRSGRSQPRSRRRLRCAAIAAFAALSAAHATTAAAAGEPAPAVTTSAPTLVGYDPETGAFLRTRDGAWELNPYAMVQLTHATTGGHGLPDASGFNLHAAKFILHGHVYDRTLTYHFQLNAGEGKVVAEDLYVRWDARPWVSVLVGQNEVPFNRQHITLEAYQELVERSLVDTRFTLQRDIGVSTDLHDAGRHVEVVAGVFNGARQNAPNDDGTYMTTLRLAVNPWGPIPFREADLDDSARPKLSLAVAGAYNPKRVPPPDGSAKPTASTLHHIWQGEVETTFRYRGLSLTTEAHVRREENDAGALRIDEGAFFQAGYFLVPHHVQVAARRTVLIGDLAKPDPASESTVGVSYYVRGHRLKLQADGSVLETREGKSAWRARAQLEFFL
jgi:phosphate-selective porin OprO/OprP